MEKRFDLYMQNPFWKEYYEKAPTDILKEFIRLQFDNSPFVKGAQDDNFVLMKKKMMNCFTNIEWQYLRDNTLNGQAKCEYIKRLKYQQ